MSKEKRTYFIIASEEGFQELIMTIEKILSGETNTYVHAFIVSETNIYLRKRLYLLRAKYYDRLIVKVVKYRRGILSSLQLWKSNYIDEFDLINFINGYKAYTDEEFYILIGSITSIERFNKIFGNHIGESSPVILETMDK